MLETFRERTAPNYLKERQVHVAAGLVWKTFRNAHSTVFGADLTRTAFLISHLNDFVDLFLLNGAC